MTEPKKVAFSTLGPVKKEKKRVKKTRSVRINLTLAESNEKFCPEFNYRELVSIKLQEKLGKKRLGDVINGPSLDPSDPFAADEDACLKALAKQMESKYANYGQGKKKRRKENDFSTLGEGYDDTDPFIDNSDACDEVVPTHMETKHRGFYINSGELDFEEVAQESPEEESVSSDTEIRRKKVVKRIESDPEDDDDDDGGEDEENKGNKTVHENGIIRPKKRKLDEGELLRKRKKMIGKFNAKNQVDKKDSDPETEKLVNGIDGKGENPPSERSIAASIEAVINKAREEAVDKKSDSQESVSGSDSSSSDSDSSGSSSSSDSDSDEEEEDEDKEGENDGDGDGDDEAGQELENGHQQSEFTDDIPLPVDLPDDLLQVINKLKEEGHTCKGSSQKFFTDYVNKLLLSIVFKLNRLGVRKKTQIYNHLSQHLPCGTQTIVKRSKNLLTEKHDSKLQEPLKRLKEAVDAQMPKLVEQHALECRKVAETKGENGGMPPEEEEEEGDKKKAKLPKKRFVFNDETRKCLCAVVKVRVQFWHLIRKRSENPEEHIKIFLDSEVRPLWPKGWMNVRTLYKESSTEHGSLTGEAPVKTTPARPTAPLGSGSTSATSSMISTQPPKPSLSATVIPKNFSSIPSNSPKSEVMKKLSVSNAEVAKKLSVSNAEVAKKLSVSNAEVAKKISVSNAEVAKKQFVSNDQKTINKMPEEVAAAHSASGGLSIKSVEKINEGFGSKVTNSKMESGIVKEKPKEINKSGVENSGISVSAKEKLTSKKSDVNVIDLSSDDDRTIPSKVSPSVNSSAKSPSDLKQGQTSSKQGQASSAEKEVKSNAVPVVSEAKKEDNLEEEMNLVMNELLQISKQKSAVEGYSDRVSPPKVSPTATSVKVSDSKEQRDSNVHVHVIQSHTQKQHSPSEYYSPKVNTPSVQAEKHSQKSYSVSPTFSSHTPSEKSCLPSQQASILLQEPPQKLSLSPVEGKTPQKLSMSPNESKAPQKLNMSAVESKTQQQQQHSSSGAYKHPSQEVGLPSHHHKSLGGAQPNSAVHSTANIRLTKELAHQSKSTHQLQSHQHPTVGMKKQTNSQSPLNVSSQPQSLKPVSDISHKKITSQQYSQPHHPQQSQQKNINVSVSTWSSKQSSDSSTKKNPSSWTSSGGDKSLAHQKHPDEVVVVSSRDPLANLRMMHGLSVSNVNKKSTSGSSSSTTTSSSSTAYHKPVLDTSSTTYVLVPNSSSKVSGNSSSSSNVSGSLSHSNTNVSTSAQNQRISSGYTSSQGKHSSSASHSSNKSSKHSSAKSRLSPYANAVNQSMMNNISQELNAYTLQQQKLSNHNSNPQQQQDIWQQMGSTYLPGMGQISNTEIVKFVSQVGKTVGDGYSQSGSPYPNPGTTHTSASPHLSSPYGDASRGNQHSHHMSSHHHFHPTHGGSDQHRGQY